MFILTWVGVRVAEHRVGCCARLHQGRWPICARSWYCTEVIQCREAGLLHWHLCWESRSLYSKGDNYCVHLFTIDHSLICVSHLGGKYWHPLQLNSSSSLAAFSKPRPPGTGHFFQIQRSILRFRQMSFTVWQEVSKGWRHRPTRWVSARLWTI